MMTTVTGAGPLAAQDPAFDVLGGLAPVASLSAVL